MSRARFLAALVVVGVVVCGSALLITRTVAAWSQSPESPARSERAQVISTGALIGSPPTLTTDQRTQLQLRVLIYRNAQLELEAVVKDLKVPGYDLDLNTLAYVKTPDPQGSK